MRSIIAVGTALAFFAVALVQALEALADETTVIETSPGQYSETYKGDDGSKLEYKRDGTKVHKEYKGADGTVIKEEGNANSVKRNYQDLSCKQETVEETKKGETKVVMKGDCAP